VIVTSGEMDQALPRSLLNLGHLVGEPGYEEPRRRQASPGRCGHCRQTDLVIRGSHLLDDPRIVLGAVARDP
jgi:hypothetical protein